MPRFATSAALILLAAASTSQAQERRGRPDGGGSPPVGTSTAPSAPTQGPGGGAAPVQAAGTPTGSFQQSCRNTVTSNGRVFSECRGADGSYRRSSIEFGQCRGDIGNQNGILACNGAVAQDGGLVAEATPATRSNDASKRKSNNNGSRNAVLSGLLGGLGGAAVGSAVTANSYENRQANHGYNNGGYNNGGYNNGGGYAPPPADRGYGDRGAYNGRGYQGGYVPPPPAAYGSNSDGDRRYGGERGRPAVVLYDGYNYTGRAVEVYGDGENLERLRFNDRARSIRIYSGRWRLCRDVEGGRCTRVTRDVPDLRAVNAADQISSIERE